MTTVDTYARNSDSFHTTWQDNILLKSVFEHRPGEKIDAIFTNSLLESTCSVPGTLGGTGSSSITVNEADHKLLGSSDTNFFSFNVTPSNCSVSATMSGPGVSESGTNSSCTQGNPAVYLQSTTYQPNTQYCIVGSHTLPNGSCQSQACIITPKAKVTSVVFEQIATDDLPIDTNPNEGYGYRMYPDDKIPDDIVDRRNILVKAKYSEPQSGVRIYFRNFDVDDPSADTAPIDANDTALIKSGNDNNGNVDGTTATKAGILAAPAGSSGCQTQTYGVSCLTDSSGTATAEFTVTKQPGDNFVVVASQDASYISNLGLGDNGIDVVDTTSEQIGGEIPATKESNNECQYGDHKGSRTEMLTVWRRLHIEVDSMGNVGQSNKETGTVSQNTVIPPMQGSIPGVGNINLSTSLTSDRFVAGRFVTVNDELFVLSNTANSVEVKNTTGQPINISAGTLFILYDDDDYNANDSIIQVGSILSYTVDGDKDEQIESLPDNFIYLSVEDGEYADGSPKNVYGIAYIIPEYNWANVVENYNQSDLDFDLNVNSDETNNDEVSVLLTNNRGSKDDERDDFWVAYFVLGYQGRENLDADADGANPGISKRTVGSAPNCDCYQSNTCPNILPAPISCTSLPTGSFGSALFQEVMQDVHRSWLFAGQEFHNIETTAPHELGHQFGLNGDVFRKTFKVMDYSVYTTGVPRPVINDIGLHPEHINIIRKRIKSPGQ